jgi:hypothetical protein
MPLLCRWILRPISKAIVCIAFLTLLSGTEGLNSVKVACTATGVSQAAADPVMLPVVRLRKLHLVRPDLIPYPIFYAIYC